MQNNYTSFREFASAVNSSIANHDDTWSALFSSNLQQGDVPTANDPHELLTILHGCLEYFERQHINNGMAKNNQNINNGGLNL